MHSKSILQAKLANLALQIVYCGTTVAIIALIVLLVRFCIDEYVIRGQSFNITQLQHFVKFIIIAVTILIMYVRFFLLLIVLSSNLVQYRKGCRLRLRFRSHILFAR